MPPSAYAVSLLVIGEAGVDGPRAGIEEERRQMYSVRECIRFGLVIGAGLGLLTEAFMIGSLGKSGAVQMILRGAGHLVGIGPFG